MGRDKEALRYLLNEIDEQQIQERQLENQLINELISEDIRRGSGSDGERDLSKPSIKESNYRKLDNIGGNLQKSNFQKSGVQKSDTQRGAPISANGSNRGITDQDVPRLGATDRVVGNLNSPDLNASDLNASDLNASDLNASDLDISDPVSLLAHYIKAQQEENMRVRELVSRMVDRMVDITDDTVAQSAKQGGDREHMSIINRANRATMSDDRVADDGVLENEELGTKSQILQLETQISELTQHINSLTQDQIVRETSEQIEMMQKEIPEFDADVVAEMMNNFYEMLINQGVDQQEAERITAISWNHPTGWFNLHELSIMLKTSALADIKNDANAEGKVDDLAGEQGAGKGGSMRKPDEHISSTSSGSRSMGIMEMLKTKDPEAQGAALLKLINR